MRSERFLNFSYKLLTFSFTNLNLPNCMNRNSRAPRSEATHLPKARCLVHPNYHISIYKYFRFRIRMRNAFEFPTYFLFVLSTSVGFRSSHRSLIFFFCKKPPAAPARSKRSVWFVVGEMGDTEDGFLTGGGSRCKPSQLILSRTHRAYRQLKPLVRTLPPPRTTFNDLGSPSTQPTP